jgi:Tol biopolymer transport system component
MEGAMSEQRFSRLVALKRFLGSWYFPAAVGSVLLIALVIWIVPRRIERVVSADGALEWDPTGAPTRRAIVWGPPRAIEGLVPAGEGSVTTPFLTDHGTTLYFTYRPHASHADIYRSRLVDNQWQPGEPMTELNSGSDDIGPVITDDGRQLYFSSNRPGGHGGFDIYVADRAGAGWGKPRNLGPTVNSAADEHDPAPSPDGLSLYFASNRPAQFDLYVSRRNSLKEEWSAPEALDALNTPANESAPRVSPSGNFLYFASDRHNGRLEPANLDLYRARLVKGQFRDVEPLGPGVNTSAHETQPALSPEGFTLIFSSDRDGASGLYVSKAQEAYARTDWDTSKLQAIAGVWWQALLLTLLLTALIAAALHGRGWLVAKASAARFVAASLLLHALLILGLWGVPLARSIAEKAEEIRASEQGPQLVEETTQEHEDKRQSFEKVAELKAPDPVPLPQATLPGRAPEQIENLVPTIPLQAAKTLTPDRVMIVPPKESAAEVRLGSLDLPRRPGQPRELATAPPIPVAPAPAETTPAEKPLEERTVTQARQEAVGPMPVERIAPRDPAPPRVEKVAETIQPRGNSDVPKVEPLAALPLRSPTRTRPLPVVDPVRVDPGAAAIAETNPGEKPIPGATVTLPRASAGPSEVQAPVLPRLPGTGEKPPVAVGTVDPKMTDVPSIAPLAGRLTRAPARGNRIAPADDRGGDPGAYLLRQGDVRKEAIDSLGGSKESEAAVERGLDWLAAHQSRDGSWSLNGFQVNCKHPQCTAAASVTSDTAGTGLALLPFLAAGHTHRAGKHQQTVARALRWLVEHQRVDGSWLSQGDSKQMYGHALAAIALCEAHGMTQDVQFRGPAQKAIDFIVKAQNPGTGGWRYFPNNPGDTSVLGWQVMALKSAQLAGLSVSPQTLDGAKRWLKSVEAPAGGQFGYLNATPTPAMTAQGLLCLQLMGTKRSDPRLQAGAEYLLRNLPQRNVDTSYYWYHATQVMYHMQGKYWKAWNEKMRDLLVTTQLTKGPMAGTWDPVDAREKTGGRICSTALRLLMLEVYYRHLPLYQQLEK